jgi:hypothetical protein
MSWIIAFIVAIVCFVIAEAGLMSKNVDIKDWQWWAIGLGETVGVLCIVYVVTRLWS